MRLRRGREIGLLVGASVLAWALLGIGVANGRVIDDNDAWYGARDGDSYDYSITPEGHPEAWARKDPAELSEILQIPDQAIARLSTDGLIEAVIKYPYLGDYIAYSSPQEGFDGVRAEFGAIDNLLAREDIAAELLTFYVQADLTEAAQNDGFAAMRIGFVEMLIAQPEVLRGVDKDKRGEIVRAVVQKWREKQEYLDGDFYDSGTSALVVARAAAIDGGGLERSTIGGEALREFIESGLTVGSDQEELDTLVSTVLEEADELYVIGQALKLDARSVGAAQGQGLVISPLAAPSYTNSSVKTPNGSTVATLKVSGELSATQISANDAWVKSNYPSAVRHRSSTAKYNCHSYAWYRTQSDNVMWMNDPTKYWSDGSYKLSATQSYSSASTALAAQADGARVYFVGGNHSGVKNGSKLYSKWGQYGLYLHSPNYTPYKSTTSLRYYKR